MSAKPEPKTSAETARAYFETVWDRHDVSRLPEFLAPDFALRFGQDPPMSGLARFEAFLKDYFVAVPDYRLVVDEVFGSGPKAVVRWTCEGTHAGNLFGVPRTDRRFRLTGISIVRCEADRIQEIWTERDLAGVRQRLTAP